uniref:Integrase catalytic domain-containing protein n=1 Tax=Vitis vinifera TaxID=29760 RepID=A5B2B8_VITVI|nr:hypothetical protein VITISV_016909 [Vitis vinifera]
MLNSLCKNGDFGTLYLELGKQLSCLPKAISSSFQLQIIYGLKRWIFDFLSFQMVYKIALFGSIQFYRRFIKDFAKFSKPLCELLVKDAKFLWDERCQKSFEQLKQFLRTTSMVRAPNWQLPFEVMCDASDFAIGVVLGQREDGKPYVIYWSFIVVFTDHSALKYLLTKQDAKARPIRWILLLQEFNLQIKEKKGVENVVADHLSRLAITHNSHGLPINDDFPEESLLLLEDAPWYAHIANYLVTGEVLSFSWPSLFKDAHAMCRSCDRCQRLRKLTRRNQMTMNPILIVDIFDVWGIDFMGPFPMSFGNSYILVGVDYVSKWVEAIPCKHNDHRVVLKFLKENIFSRFGVPKAIISDGGTHFCNKPLETLLAKYGVKHKSMAKHAISLWKLNTRLDEQLRSQSNSEDFSLEDERLGSSSLGVKKSGCACHIEYKIAEEAMNFMSYVAEVSRRWDEPNAGDMGRMTSQPNAKGEMYNLNDNINMKAKIVAMARRLEELEMKKMQEV